MSNYLTRNRQKINWRTRKTRLIFAPDTSQDSIGSLAPFVIISKGNLLLHQLIFLVILPSNNISNFSYKVKYSLQSSRIQSSILQKIMKRTLFLFLFFPTFCIVITKSEYTKGFHFGSNISHMIIKEWN